MKKTLLSVIMLFWAGIASAQLSQMVLKSPNRNEIATKIVTLPGGDAVVGGYIYDITGGTVSNADMVLARVSSTGEIKWQKQWGTPNSTVNDLLQGLSVTANGDILVVGEIGRTSVYQNNTAFIARVDPANGNFIWHNTLRETGSTHGETFFDVTELGDGRVMGVGSASFDGFSSRALLAVFDGTTGAYDYAETYDIYNGDDFLGVVADGNDVYLTGWYVGLTYKDMRLIRYTPGVSSGTVVWDEYYELTGVPNNSGSALNCNGLGKPYIRNNKLVITGSALSDYSVSAGNSQFIFEYDLSTSTADVRYIVNSQNWAGNNAMYPVDDQHFFSVQNPATSFLDVTLWTSASFSNATISDFNTFGSGTTINQTRHFNFSGQHSIIDMTMFNNYLYMAGGRNAGSSGSTDNDIYFVISHQNLTNKNATCDLDSDHIQIGTPTLSIQNPSVDVAGIVNIEPLLNVDIADPGLDTVRICGDTIKTSCNNCELQCYWRIDGNNAITSSNFLGTINSEDIRFKTTNTQRAVIERNNGYFGLDAASPTARLHVLCSQPAGNPSDVRFEKLPQGEGAVLVIDPNGYVYQSRRVQAKPGETELANEVQELKQQVQYLMNLVKNNDGNSGTGSAPNGMLKIYPNPAYEKLNIDIASSVKGKLSELRIYDANGKMVFSEGASGESSAHREIDISRFPAGTYSVMIYDDRKQILGTQMFSIVH